jgi:hypothetical protein
VVLPKIWNNITASTTAMPSCMQLVHRNMKSVSSSADIKVFGLLSRHMVDSLLYMSLDSSLALNNQGGC